MSKPAFTTYISDMQPIYRVWRKSTRRSAAMRIQYDQALSSQLFAETEPENYKEHMDQPKDRHLFYVFYF